MTVQLFNLKREVSFKNRRRDQFFQHDFLHKQVFLDHIDSLSMILMDMPNITFVNVPEYFLDLPEVQAFLVQKKVTSINSISRDSEILPSMSQEQNAVIALLCCHTINDLVGYLIQIRRCLAGDGIFIASFMGENVVQILRNALTQSELEEKNGMQQRFHPTIDIRDLGNLLLRAGFSLPVTDMQIYPVRYQKFESIFNDIRGAGYSNSLSVIPTSLTRAIYKKALENLEICLQDHILNIDVITATARCPSDLQQKPLKPGSAQVSLKEILK